MRSTFSSLGQYCQAVARQESDGLRDPRLADAAIHNFDAAASGLSIAAPAEGGHLVEENLADELIVRVYEESSILRRVTRREIPTTSTKTRFPTIDESSRVAGSRFGGAQAFWESEAEEVSASNPKFAVLEPQPFKLACRVPVTNELLDDAANLDRYVMEVAERELRFKAEDAIVAGTGVGQCLGLTNAGCKIEVSAETSQTAETVWGENIVKMYSRLWGPSRRTAVWLAHESVDVELLSLATDSEYGSAGSTQFGSRLYNPDGNARSAGYPTLCGCPVIPCEYCQVLGTAGDLVLTDLSQYLVADKSPQGVLSLHVRFLYDEGVFRFTWRIAGQPIWASALTPLHGTDTLSPIVTLATRE